MAALEKILVIGSGSAGKRHFRLLKNICPEAEIRIQGSREFNEKITLNSHTNISKGQESFEPDLVIVASPATSHIQIAHHYVQLGSNLLIEKPLSINNDGLIEFIKLSRERNCKVVVGYNLRYSESLEFFRNCIQSNRVGRIQSVQIETGQYLPDWRPTAKYSDGVSANKSLGGGVVLELSHELDYLMWIFGKPEWVIASTQKLSDLELDVEDSAFIIIGMNDQANQKKLIANVSLDFIRRDRTRTCLAIGENGTLRWDGISQTVSVYDSSSSDWKTLYQGSETTDRTYELQLRNLVASIEDDTDSSGSLADAAAVMNLIDAIRESSLIGKRIEIEAEN